MCVFFYIMILLYISWHQEGGELEDGQFVEEVIRRIYQLAEQVDDQLKPANKNLVI